MTFKPGQRLTLVRRYEGREWRTVATVVELRKRGTARLSNGWMVNEDGIADGNSRVVEVQEPAPQQEAA